MSASAAETNGVSGPSGNGLIEARFRLPYPAFTLDVDLRLPARGITALFGPSGSGKTTLLRCIAGLARAPDARLVVKGQAWQDAGTFLPPYRRPVGYVFQDANLFPHLDVNGNLDFGARRSRSVESDGRAGQARHDRAALLELLGIGHLLARRVQGLSGGERQRVAIARALLAAPQLLLLDEPLAALERERRMEILPYLDRLHDELDIPVLFVSHAADEVARLADHLVLMEAGRAVASGPMAELGARLDSPLEEGVLARALARDEDAGVVIAASVAAHDDAYHLTRLEFPGGAVYAGLRDDGTPPKPGDRLRIAIHARDVSIALSDAGDSSILNRLPAVVTSFADAAHPSQLLVGLDAGGTALLARITRRSRDQLGLREGMRVWAQIKSVALAE